LGSGKFYVQPIGDSNIASLEKQLANLNLQETPLLGAFNPKKGDTVLCPFGADKAWYRAMVSSYFLVLFPFLQDIYMLWMKNVPIHWRVLRNTSLDWVKSPFVKAGRKVPFFLFY
jgi:hypothetical protein